MPSEQGPSLANCTVDGCMNMYPLAQKLDGIKRYPDCRGEDIEADWVEENLVCQNQKVWTNA